MTVLGQDFRPGAMVYVRAPSDDTYPLFGEVTHIILHEDSTLTDSRV